jgi:hypothetical protein
VFVHDASLPRLAGADAPTASAGDRPRRRRPAAAQPTLMTFVKLIIPWA